MTESKPVSNRLAPAMLWTTAALVAVSWYLRPERAAVWVGVIVLLGVMTAVLRARARLRDAESIRNSVVFGAAVVALTLVAKLLPPFAAATGADLSRRGTMIVLGAVFIATGNALPKRLTPLSAISCGAARVQAFQRFAGWTWVLMGLAFSAVWIVLPVREADPVSTALLAAGMFAVGAALVWLLRGRRKVEEES